MSIRAMNQATATMNQLQQQIDVIGHNMSNSSTTGYKSGQAEFSSLLFQQINNMTDPQNEVGRVTANGVRVGMGARLGAIHTNNKQGALNRTDRDLDVALLQGNHYFEIAGPDDDINNVRFTRDGSFYLQPTGNDTQMELVTKDGHQVIGRNGNPIQFIGDNVSGIQIRDDGTIMVERGQQIENAGSISVISINNPRVLESAGENYYRLPNPDNSGVGYADIVENPLDGAGLMKNRTLEMSNVDIANQMSSLINAQRAYQFNARTISMADQMQGLINQVR